MDGKQADYHAGRLRYTPDGKHLVGVGSRPDGKQAILVDGKVVEPLGQVERIAVSSTGDVAAVVVVGQTRQVYVNGKSRGVSPPLRVLELPAGAHTVEIRNSTFPAHVEQVQVKAGEAVRIRHRFK